MALRLAGEEFSVLQGMDGLGWLRSIEASDGVPGLQVKQSGSGPLFEFYDGAVKVLFADDGGPVALGRDISLGANKLKWTNLLLKDNASDLEARNAADNGFIPVRASHYFVNGDIRAQVNGTVLDANNVDNHYLGFRARDNGVGLMEVARQQGASEPYFLLTHGKVGDVASLPTASASFRGFIYRVEGGAGVADKFYMCRKTATDTYEWYQIF